MNISDTDRTARFDDDHWMGRALRLAMRGWGRTSPNPMVGAVIVRGGCLVGDGFHLRSGGAHEEINAIREAAGKTEGSTMYVTLEPCSSEGKTPPCTDAILAAGIRRVVVGCVDPNPEHRGKGSQLLRESGVTVCVGVLEERCIRLNEAFFCWIRHTRPFVCLKMGMTLDGKIATASGDSQWITGTRARAYVQRLRRWADAVMVGAETVRQDDPGLTVRIPRDWWRQPQKIVWTRSEFPDRNLKIWRDPERSPQFAAPASLCEWREFLGRLGRQGITSLLIEGGGELAASVLRAGIVDRVNFVVAPLILGGRDSRAVVAGDSPASLQESLRLSELHVRQLGKDLLISGRPE